MSQIKYAYAHHQCMYLNNVVLFETNEEKKALRFVAVMNKKIINAIRDYQFKAKENSEQHSSIFVCLPVFTFH
ncbi:MAG: hypothetical protein ACQEXE_17480 [Bacillota bacterium]